MVFDWYYVTVQSLENLWAAFLNFIPLLIGAIIVFAVGWFISVGVGRLVTEVLKRIKFNQIFEKGNWDEAMAKADIKVDASGFIGGIAKWVMVIVFLLAAVEILGFNEFAYLLQKILAYLPNVIVAALIFVVTVILVDIIEKIVRVTVESIKVGYGAIVSAVIKWSIWVFAILAILTQLKFEAADWIMDLIKIAFMGLVAMMALAFGLGGKEAAAEILQDVKKKLKD